MEILWNNLNCNPIQKMLDIKNLRGLHYLQLVVYLKLWFSYSGLRNKKNFTPSSENFNNKKVILFSHTYACTCYETMFS